MRVLVVETGNMLAQVIMRWFSEAGDDVLGVTGGRRTRNVLSMDIRGPAFTGFLRTNQFDLVINCAAVGDPYAGERPADAVWMNGYLPHLLEKTFVFSSTRVFQLSTSQVFSGARGPYDEAAIPDSPRFVSRSRAVGELDNEKDLTIRFDAFERPTCARGKGFLLWFLEQKNEIRAATGVRFSPVSAPEAARCLREAYDLGASGLWHLAPARSTDAYELARMFSEAFDRDLKVRSVPGAYSDRSLASARADVPAVSDYPEMIPSLRSWMEAHEELYAASERNCF